MFVLKNPSFEANLVLATLNPEMENHSSVNAGLKKKTVPKKAPSRNSKTVSRPSKAKSTVKNHQTSKRPSNNQKKAEEDRFSIGAASMSVQDINLSENNVIQSPPTKVNTCESTVVDSSSSSSVIKKTNSALQNLFPPIPRKKSNPGGSNQRNDDEIIPCSPPRRPSKKARLIFQKCFKATFDPRMLPGHDEVLAEDSDEEK